MGAAIPLAPIDQGRDICPAFARMGRMCSTNECRSVNTRLGLLAKCPNHLNDIAPSLHPTAWAAPVCGPYRDVRLGAGASVGTVVRADKTAILIGKDCNVQDGAIVATCGGTLSRKAAHYARAFPSFRNEPERSAAYRTSPVLRGKSASAIRYNIPLFQTHHPYDPRRYRVWHLAPSFSRIA